MENLKKPQYSVVTGDMHALNGELMKEAHVIYSKDSGPVGVIILCALEIIASRKQGGHIGVLGFDPNLIHDLPHSGQRKKKTQEKIDRVKMAAFGSLDEADLTRFKALMLTLGYELVNPEENPIDLG